MAAGLRFGGRADSGADSAARSVVTSLAGFEASDSGVASEAGAGGSSPPDAGNSSFTATKSVFTSLAGFERGRSEGQGMAGSG